MFDPRDFFLSEEILPPQKRARFLSSSSDFSTPPQVFEIGESHYKKKGMAPQGDTKICSHQTMTQAVIRKLVAAALEAQAATMANADNTNRNTDKLYPCVDSCRPAIGIREDYMITGLNLNALNKESFCPRYEVKKMGSTKCTILCKETYDHNEKFDEEESFTNYKQYQNNRNNNSNRNNDHHKLIGFEGKKSVRAYAVHPN
ncbi:hypothetical protein Tco_0624782 [Tanacetum coccineum]|uniref:Uncharacterized protein n=1 Tax=Tanacetum coccineum TaxID=301880 RepID=A0ABQ4WEW9_9ASTR